MNLRDQIVLRVVSRFTIPFILLYAFYVQFHGDYSPGGGFQAGVIFASAFSLYALIYGLEKAKSVVSEHSLIRLSALGTLIYAGTGVVCLLNGKEFLNYAALSNEGSHGQHLGIMFVELGVGITVFSIILLLFYLFAGYRKS
ncbi:MAG: Na(+)/H(+) antiporter subunit B [Rickettsiales bacterium]|nr:Na(+)/H(+) antiporter subunit B [Rickettsiales bacterium]